MNTTTTTNTTTTARPFVIRLVGRRRRPYFLKSYRATLPITIETLGKDHRAKITKTDYAENARGFATLEEALEFRNTHAPMFFGYEWEVVTR